MRFIAAGIAIANISGAIEICGDASHVQYREFGKDQLINARIVIDQFGCLFRRNPLEIDALTKRLIEFRDARDWKQFHSLKDLIISLNLESAEVLELTQWKNSDTFERSLEDDSQLLRLKEECADVFAYLLLIAERAGIDLVKATHEKIDANELKYPVEKAKGNARKYDQLQ